MRKFLLPLLSLLVLIVAGLATRFYLEASAARADLDAATKERASLRARVAELENLKARLQDEVAAAQSRDRAATVEAKDGGARASAPGGQPAGRSETSLARASFGPDNPQMQRVMAMQQKAQLDSRYAALFKKLGLSSQQVEQLKNLLVEKQVAVMDVYSAARAQGLTGPGSREQIQALAQQTTGEIDSSIRSLLGDGGFQQLQQYEKTAPQRAVVDQLASRLSYTNAPLTGQQAEQLVQILADATPRTGRPDIGAMSGGGVVRVVSSAVSGGLGAGPGAIMSATLGGTAPIPSEALSQAQTVLSSDQFAALQQIQAEQQAQQQVFAQMIQETMKNQGSGHAGPGGPPAGGQMMIQIGTSEMGPPPAPPPRP